MFLRSKIRRRDGKEHRAWSVVENRRIRDGRVVQRQVLISHDGQWRRAHGIWGSIADAPRPADRHLQNWKDVLQAADADVAGSLSYFWTYWNVSRRAVACEAAQWNELMFRNDGAENRNHAAQ